MTEFVQIVIGGIQQGSIYALLALGFLIVYRVTGVINLAQGAFCTLGALTAYSLQTSASLPPLLAAMGAILATTALAAIAGRVLFVPGLTRLTNSNMLMLTAGLLTLFEGFVLVVWGSQPYALPSFSGEKPLRVAGLLLPTQGLWVGGVTIVIIVALGWMLARTRLGQSLRACAENPTAATLMGVDVPRMQLFAFALAGAIGAAAGVVVAPAIALQFDTGRLLTISGFIAVAIGGIASFPGAIAGGLLLGLVGQLATAYVSSLFSNALALGLLLIVLVWRPSGLIRAGATRRSDVRDEARVWTHVSRISAAAAWRWGSLLVLLALAAPFVLGNALLGALIITLILFIALIGQDVLMGYGGQISLGQAGFMAIGGYTASYLATEHNIPPIVGVAAGMGLSLVCAIILAAVTLRLRGLYMALATLAFGLLIDSCAIGFDDITGGPSGMVGIPDFSIAGLEFGTPLRMYFLVLGLVVLILISVAGAMRSGFGRALQAIRTDPLAAAALGVNVVGCKMAAFGMSAVLASLSGSLYAFHFHFLSPEMVGTPRSLELVSMLVIGGEGTLIGPLLGAALLTILPTVFQPLAIYKTLASGALLAGCSLYLPQGMFGLVNRILPTGPHRATASKSLTAA
jgi:branched-chain amino acid transport system permease protein